MKGYLVFRAKILPLIANIVDMRGVLKLVCQQLILRKEDIQEKLI